MLPILTRSSERQATKTDWAQEMEQLLRRRYAKTKKILLVCDNLNKHTRRTFYEAFEAAKARQIVQRLEFHYTPKHGSWLNISENELSSMTRQCIASRRIPDIKIFRCDPPYDRSIAIKTNEVWIGNSLSIRRDQN